MIGKIKILFLTTDTLPSWIKQKNKHSKKTTILIKKYNFMIKYIKKK